MITRAQAEALLTLAESLEACERLNVGIAVPGRCHVLLQSYGAFCEPVDLRQSDDLLVGAELRTAVADLMPKHTGS